MAFLPALLAATLACSGAADPGAPVSADSSHRALFERGISFADFLARAERRKDQWALNYREAAVPDALLARARGVGGNWKVLVVAVDGCSDSVNTIPYLARLLEQVVGVELRVVGSEEGRWVMDAHRTPDGRGATPTVVLLDDAFVERGCFIERPGELQRWIASQKGKMKDDDIFSRKMRWYDEDRGSKTTAEFVAILESAGRGVTVCGGSQG